MHDPRALKAMVSIVNPSKVKSDIFKGVRMPYKRSKEALTRKPYDLAEARLRKEVVKELKKQGFIVKRVETLSRGFGDLWLFHAAGRWCGWAELKTPTGRLSDEQKKFQELCGINGINYVIIRSVEDAKNIIKTDLTKQDKSCKL